MPEDKREFFIFAVGPVKAFLMGKLPEVSAMDEEVADEDDALE